MRWWVGAIIGLACAGLAVALLFFVLGILPL
jgi:hypothetical protein